MPSLSPSELPLMDLDELAARDAAGTLVLSVNNRHARRIVSLLSQRLDAGSPVMAVPHILPLQAWLHQLAELWSFEPDHGLARHQVDSFGSRYLWQECIRRLEPDNFLLNLPQAAQLAAEADLLMDDWHIRVDPAEATPDYQRFMAWRGAYRASLDELQIDDAGRSLDKLCQAVQNGRLAVPVQTVVLAGFVELAPRVSRLLAGLRDRGLALFALRAPPAAPPELSGVQAQDSPEEWRLAAQWAARQLDAHPQGRFAILAPALEGCLPMVHRVLHAALAPQSHSVNIGLAPPLSEWALPRAALAWLTVLAARARGRPIAASVLGQALLAGACAGGRTEHHARALLDARWRHRRTVSLSAAAFSQALEPELPALARAWQACLDSLDKPDQRGAARMDVWVQRFRAWLDSLGFPGDGPIDSAAYQSLQALDGALEWLAGLAPLAGRPGFQAALALFARLLAQTPFQPQRDAQARLDVLGLLEADGGRWDGVWILGLTDEVLPAPPRPNPLLPPAALRRAGAPRATAERELHWARQLFANLLRTAPAIWLSHPLMEGDRRLRPSPLLPATVPFVALRPEQAPLAPQELETRLDDRGPPLAQGEPVHGGVAVLDTQARNPLWAFATYRLGARALPDYAADQEENLRGLFLHRAMELVWCLLQAQPQLQASLAQGRLPALVAQCVAQAAQETLGGLDPAVCALEMARARPLVLGWLETEAQRPPFSVLALERQEHWVRDRLGLRLRLDRLDQLDDGRLVIIDYKTGATAPRIKDSWARERPIDLQLPFYAAVQAKEAPVAALAVVGLHARKTEVCGLADGEGLLPGLVATEGWDAVLARWRQAIEALAEEFSQGHAANYCVHPADLRYCDVLPFLRLTEELADDDDPAE